MRAAQLRALQPGPSMACPSFFRAGCRAAANRAPDQTYAGAGYSLAGAIGGLSPHDMEDDEWDRVTDELMTAICPSINSVPPERRRPPDDKAVLAWFGRWLLRCLDLVPYKRRARFLEGIYRHVIDEGGDFSR